MRKYKYFIIGLLILNSSLYAVNYPPIPYLELQKPDFVYQQPQVVIYESSSSHESSNTNEDGKMTEKDFYEMGIILFIVLLAAL